MSDPAELNRILHDLASGMIDADQAARLIAELDAPAQRVEVAIESLYDTPPSRRLIEEPDAAEPVTESSTAEEPDAAEPVTESSTAEEPDTAEPDAAEAVTEKSTVEELDAEPVPAATAEPDLAGEPDQTGAEPDQPAGEPDLTDEPDQQADTEPDQGVDDDPGHSLFDIQMEDVAATAGEVFRDASDFARSAWHRIGQFASTVIPTEQDIADTGTTEQPAEASTTARPTGSRGIERLILRSVGRRVRLVGDPRVATISVDGPHTLRRQGVTLEVSTEGELGLNLDGFSVVRPPRSVEDLRVLGFGQELVIRVNPAIPVDAEVTGSRLTTVDIPYLGRIRVSAGSASLSGVVELGDALIQAGGASLSGPLSEGRSRVKVESGNLTIRLTRGANVTIRSRTQLGRVSWPGEPHGDLDEFVVGNGSAQLEVGVVMGRAVVRVED